MNPAATAENEVTEHSHEGHDHAHEAHAQAQPTLNPECTREVQVEAPAEEVSKAFRTVLKKYQKLARIPRFPSRQGAGDACCVRGSRGRCARMWWRRWCRSTSARRSPTRGCGRYRSRR